MRYNFVPEFWPIFDSNGWKVVKAKVTGSRHQAILGVYMHNLLIRKF